MAGDEWLLANDATGPTYNHTRRDSPATPCALCVARARVKELEAALAATAPTPRVGEPSPPAGPRSIFVARDGDEWGGLAHVLLLCSYTQRAKARRLAFYGGAS